MAAELYWIDPGKSQGRLAVAPRPRAGQWLENEIRSWRTQGVDVVICLLEDEESAELDLAAESSLCRQHGIEFVQFPIKDRGVPQKPITEMITDKIIGHLAAGQGVLIHCRAGIGRTGLVAACTLIRRGMTAEDALRSVSHARRLVVPDTPEQRTWILNFGKS